MQRLGLEPTPIHLPAPHAVGFDLGDTLVEYEGVRLDWQSEYPAALAAIAATCGQEPSDAQVEAASQVLLQFNTRVTGRAHEVDYTEIFGAVVAALGLRAVAGSAGAERSRDGLVEKAVDAFFALFRRRLHAMPGAPELLDRLDRYGIPVSVLTDVPYGMPRRLVLEDLEAAGLSRLADVTVTSVEVGVRKPSREGFHLLSRRLGVAPGQMWFVGNEHRDVAGAKAARMTAVLLWRSDDPAPDWGQDLQVAGLDTLRLELSAVLRR